MINHRPAEKETKFKWLKEEEVDGAKGLLSSFPSDPLFLNSQFSSTL